MAAAEFNFVNTAGRLAPPVAHGHHQNPGLQL